MLLWNQRAANQYCQIVEKTDVTDQRAIHLHVGSTLLEIQVHIYEFFLSFIKKILGTDWYHIKNKHPGPMEQVLLGLEQEWMAVSDNIIRGLHQPPGSANIAEAQRLVAAELVGHVDFLAALREDPKAFFGNIKELTPIADRLHEDQGESAIPPPDFARATEFLVITSMMSVYYWSEIERHLSSIIYWKRQLL